MNDLNENTPDVNYEMFLSELAQGIAQAKSEILKGFLSQSKIERKDKKLFLAGTDIEVRMELKLYKRKTQNMYELYEIYLEEVKEPIHTLGIIISFEDKKVQVIPIFDKEAKEYIKEGDELIKSS